MPAFLLLLLWGAMLASEPIPAATIAGIDLSDARSDDGWVAPVARSLAKLERDPRRRERFDALMARIDAWAPAGTDAGGLYRRLNAAALADLGRSDLEAEVNCAVFAGILALPDRAAAVQAAASVCLGRSGGAAVASSTELGLVSNTTTDAVDERIRLLARKLLGRLQGRLPVQ